MNNNLVQIRLHGKLGLEVGEAWSLAVESVAEAIHAINVLGKQKLNKFLAKKENCNAEFRVLINGDDFVSEKPLNNIESVKDASKSNLVIPLQNLKTIDILPIIEGSSSGALNIVGIILGVVLLAIAIFVPGLQPATYFALALIGGGLVVAGIIGLLAKPPKFDDFREIEGNKKVSYLFNGPENSVREGGPVPIGYGQLLIGSQVIAASYNTYDVVSDDGSGAVNVAVNGGASVESANGTAPEIP